MRLCRFSSTFLVALFALCASVAGTSAQGQAINFDKSYSPANIGPGSVTRLTFTFGNATGTPYQGLAFTDTLTDGQFVASPANIVSTCVDTDFSAPAGGTSITLTSADIPANATCTISLDVTATGFGTFNNTTGDLTSVTPADNFGTASASFDVSSDRPAFFKSFAPGVIDLGQRSTLTFAIDNTANGDGENNLFFTDDLPAGIVVADPPNATNSCAGSVIADAGSSTIALQFGIVFSNLSCTISVDVEGVAAGTFVNSVELFSSSGSSGFATDDITVNGPAPDSPFLIKSFTDDPVGPGGTATLRFTLSNASRTFTANNVSFSDDIDQSVAGLVVSASSPTVNTCGGSVSGTDFLSVSGVTLAPEASCIIEVQLDVPGTATAGSYENTTSAISATIDGSPVAGNTATDFLTIQQLQAPVLTKEFTDDPADAGDTVTLRFTITNPNASGELNTIRFEDDLSAITDEFADINLPAPGFCNTTGTAAALAGLGDSRILVIDNAVLAAGASCTFDVTIDLPLTLSPGTYPNTTTRITAQEGGIIGRAATDDLVVGGSANVSFSKAFASSEAVEGSQVDLTFTIASTGDSSAVTDIGFTDDLENDFVSGATIASFGTNTCGGTASGTTELNYTGGSLLAGGDTCTITITVQLPDTEPPTTGPFTNTSSALSYTAGGTFPAPAASDDLQITAFAPVVLTKTFDPDTAIPGQEVEIDFTLTNPNAEQATNINFADDIGDGLPGATVSSDDQAGVCGAGTVIGTGTDTIGLVSAGPLAGGGSCTFSVSVLVPASTASGDYVNRTQEGYAFVGPAVSATVVPVSVATDTLTVNAEPLLFSKEFTNDPAAPGGTVTLRFTIENASAFDAVGGAFDDDLGAAGIDFTGSPFPSLSGCDILAPFTVDPSADLISLSGISIPAGSTCVIDFDLPLDPSQPEGTFLNTTSELSYQINSAARTSGSATDTLRVSNLVPQFSKSFADPVAPGGTATLTFTIDNRASTSEATDLAFTDNLNAMLSGATATNLPLSNVCGAGSSLTGTSLLTFTGGSIPARDACTFVVDVLVPASAAGGTYPNTTSNLTSSGLVLDGPATASLLVAPPPEISKSFASSPVEFGEPVLMTLSIDNSASPIPATNLTVTDPFPPGMFVTDLGSAMTTCTGGMITINPPYTSLSYSGGSVAAGGTCEIEVEVASDQSGPNPNSFTLTSSLGDSGSASAVLEVNPTQPLTVDKAFSQPTATLGESLTLTLVVDNPNDFVQFSSLELDDTFPAGLEVTGAIGESAGCSALGGSVSSTVTSVTWAGTLDGGATCTLTVPVTVVSIVDDIPNTAFLTSAGIPVDDATDTLDVIPPEPLTLTKAFAFSPTANVAELGQPGTFVLTLSNPVSNLVAADVAVFDQIPALLVAAGGSQSTVSGTCSDLDFDIDSAQRLNWFGTIAPGDICQLTVNVTAESDGDIPNTATLTSTFNPGGLEASDTLTVNPGRLPEIDKDFALAGVEQGESVDFTIALTNPNEFTAMTGVAMTDMIPAGLVINTAAFGDAGCAGGVVSGPVAGSDVTFTGSLDPLQTCTITVGVQVTAATDVINTARVLSDLNPDEADVVEDSATIMVTPGPVPSVTKTFLPDAIAQGGVVTLRLTVTNENANLAMTNVTLTDDMPDELEVAEDGADTTSCEGGIIDPVAGDNVITWTGGTVAAGETCTIEVQVQAVGSGVVRNTVAVTSAFNASPIEASAELTIDAALGPVIEKAFLPATAEVNQPVVLELTLTNPNAFVDITDISMVDDLDPRLEMVTAVSNEGDCVDGNYDGEPGDSTISWVGGTIPVGGVCTIRAEVRATESGTIDNTAIVRSEFNDDPNEATAQLEVTGILGATLVKAFSPDNIIQGETTEITLTIGNPNGFVDLTNVDLKDVFPTDSMVVTTAAAKSDDTTCVGGTLSGAVGEVEVTWTGGTVPAAQTCDITFGVQVLASADVINTATVNSAQNSDEVSASATVLVTPAPPPEFFKSFTPDTIVRLQLTRLSFVIDNSAALVPATELAFADMFDSSIRIAREPDVENSCGGTFIANTGESEVSLTGGTVAAGATCRIALDVVASQAGTFPNETGELTSSLGFSGTALATLIVTEIVVGTLTIEQRASEDGTFTFSSAEPNLNFSITTVAGRGTEGPITLQAGTYTIDQTPAAGFGNTDVTCSDRSAVINVLDGIVTVDIGAEENVICTFTSLRTDETTSIVINNFLLKRADIMLTSDTRIGRRLNRLNNGTGATRASFNTGDILSFLPVRFDPMALIKGSDTVEVSGSLFTIRETEAKIALAHGGDPETTYVSHWRWDVWFEGQYKSFTENDDTGHFGILFVGTDYLVNPNLLVGVMLQFDTMHQNQDQGFFTSTVDGNGWMAGPYMTARLSPRLYFDARVAWGTSTNDVSPFGTYTDQFTTDRWIAMANLTGEFKNGPWTVRPNASLAFWGETQHAYVDSLAVLIPRQTVEMGQLKLGPTISGYFEGTNGTVFQPTLTLEAIYQMGHTIGGVGGGTTSFDNGWRGRTQVGLGISGPSGTSIHVSTSYDGLFRPGFETIGFQFDVTIPLSIARAQ